LKPKILIIDDDKDFVEDLSILLENKFSLSVAFDEAEGLSSVREEPPEIVLLDLMLGSSSGLDVLKKIKAEDASLPVIMITDHASVDTAIQAIRDGASDYISKTPRMSELELIIERSLKQYQLQSQVDHLQAGQKYKFNEMIGSSTSMEQLRHQINRLAENTFPVLITGESGTGKELVAYQIHMRSDRRNKPFVSINCAAIPKDLIESELFGHEKGSFTGATQRRAGRFEVAEGGILFLDEIADLGLESQVKLLRVLQEKEFSRIGSNSIAKADVRIIAATNRDLEALVELGSFREDLYYRLDVLQLKVPSLRKRIEDIPALADHFLKLASMDAKLPPKAISRDAYAALSSYSWPGNIRELRNTISRALILSEQQTIQVEDFSLPQKATRHNTRIDFDLTLDSLEQARKLASDKAKRAIESDFIKQLMLVHKNNVSQAARALNMNRASLHKMIKRAKEAANTETRD